MSDKVEEREKVEAEEWRQKIRRKTGRTNKWKEEGKIVRRKIKQR